MQKDLIHECFLSYLLIDIVPTISPEEIYQNYCKNFKNKWLPTSLNWQQDVIGSYEVSAGY